MYIICLYYVCIAQCCCLSHRVSALEISIIIIVRYEHVSEFVCLLRFAFVKGYMKQTNIIWALAIGSSGINKN